MMTYSKAALVLSAALALGACSSTPDRYAVSAPVVTEKQRIAFASLEVKDVSLPSYAAADEIAVQDAEGKLVTSKDLLWADNQERAVALELARNLAKLSGARIASEPWPFEAFPEARLEVRFESLVAREGGQFHTAGQYFVGVPDGGRERSGMFDLAVAFDPEAGPQAIANARGQIILELATYIARKGLR